MSCGRSGSCSFYNSQSVRAPFCFYQATLGSQVGERAYYGQEPSLLFLYWRKFLLKVGELPFTWAEGKLRAHRLTSASLCSPRGWSLNIFKSHPNGEGDGTPLQYACLENPMDGGAWWAAVHGVAKSRTWMSDFTFTSLSCIGEGNGDPLQCSCLENPRDGGAWWAAIYGVAQSWTQLKQLSKDARRHIVCSEIGRCNILNMSVLPTPVYGFNAISVSSPKLISLVFVFHKTGVAKSQTRLSVRTHTHKHTENLTR